MMVDTRAALEAVLFVAPEPIPETELAGLVELSKAQVRKELEALGVDLDERGSGLVLRNVGGGWRLYTRPEARPFLERFAQSARASRLSKPALETLAVVAYRQPVTKAQVSEIRGVDAESALQTLEDRGLIEDAGRLPGPGQAVLYATTALFLEKTGLADLEELPPLADYVPPPDIVEALEKPFRAAEPPSSESTS
ncbi:MAG: SMC-Scp complex subunit ScpB [Acidimicrobiia bacterium]|nr:SMC-Scp complex subunit ScpB [Acidimicrobiia bacterium]